MSADLGHEPPVDPPEPVDTIARYKRAMADAQREAGMARDLAQEADRYSDDSLHTMAAIAAQRSTAHGTAAIATVLAAGAVETWSES